MDIDGSLGQPQHQAEVEVLSSGLEEEVYVNGTSDQDGTVAQRGFELWLQTFVQTHKYGTAVREMYRQLPVRVHVRKPGRDSWVYVGRATVSHEVIGQTSRVGTSSSPCTCRVVSF